MKKCAEIPFYKRTGILVTEENELIALFYVNINISKNNVLSQTSATRKYCKNKTQIGSVWQGSILSSCCNKPELDYSMHLR